MPKRSATPQPRVDTQNLLSLRNGSPLSTLPDTLPVSLDARLVAAVPCARDTTMEADNIIQPTVASRTRYRIDYIDVPNLPGGVHKDDYAKPTANCDGTTIPPHTRGRPRVAASAKSCHQCKSHRHEAKMKCAGKKQFRGHPCTLMYCKNCVDKQ